MSKEKVLTLLEPLGETGNYTKFYFPKTDVMKVFLKGGSNLLVNVKTGDAVYESVTRRRLSERCPVYITIRDNGGLTSRIFSLSPLLSLLSPASSC